ncbi:MAG: MEDS domain-containing protein [Actinomycetota bacterium]|nr:MEDS domain-containing protein [Actinomycetota bacterium]
MTEILFTDDGQKVGIGAHVCAMHEDPAGVLDTLVRTFVVGLRENERCVYIAPPESADEVRRGLGASEVDVEKAEAEGRFVFLTDKTAVLKDGVEFDPEFVIDAIKSLLGETLESGYAGLRLSADVPWISRDVPGEDRIMEFEALADEIVNNPGTPLLAVCQYRLSELDPEDSLEILERHPFTLVGGNIHVNDEYGG